MLSEVQIRTWPSVKFILVPMNRAITWGMHCFFGHTYMFIYPIGSELADRLLFLNEFPAEHKGDFRGVSSE